MKYFAIIPFVLVIFGCRPPESLIKLHPIFDLTTILSPKEVVSHITTKWGEHWVNVNTVIDGEGYKIFLGEGHSPVCAVRVQPIQAGGSRFTFHAQGYVGSKPMSTWIDQAVTEIAIKWPLKK